MFLNKNAKNEDHVAKARPWVLPQCLLLPVVLVNQDTEENGNFTFIVFIFGICSKSLIKGPFLVTFRIWQ